MAHQKSPLIMSGDFSIPYENNPLNLEKEICEPIFSGNHRALLGDTLKPVDIPAVTAELNRLQASLDSLDEADQSIIPWFKSTFNL